MVAGRNYKKAAAAGSKATAVGVVTPYILTKIMDGFVYRMDICACREGCNEYF